MVFGEYGNYCLLFFDITLHILVKNMYANLLTRSDDACIITSYLLIYLSIIYSQHSEVQIENAHEYPNAFFNTLLIINSTMGNFWPPHLTQTHVYN